MSSLVLTSIKPLIVVSQITGFILFKIDTKSWRAVVTFWNIPPTIFSICINIFIHYIFWYTYFTQSFDFHGSEVIRLNVPRLIYANVLSFTVIKIMLFIKRQNTMKMLKLLNEIDEKFLNFNLKFNYEMQQNKLKLTLFGSLSLAILMVFISFVCYQIYNIGIDPMVALMQFWAFVASVMTCHHILVGLIGIRHRFELLNLFIEHNSHLIDGYILRNLASLHFTICRLIKAFNDVYGLIIFCSTSIAFGWFCLFLFGIANGSVQFVTDYFFFVLLKILINVLVFSAFFSFVLFVERAMNEGRMTTKYLYKILHRTDDFRKRELIGNFINQINNTKMEISCGLFDVNWKFLFKFITAGIMYFVILLEFEASSKKEKC